MSTAETFGQPVEHVGADHSLRAGADALKETLQAITELSNDTCCQLGEDVDSRDYAAMADVIVTSIQANLINGQASHREGYLRALTDFLSVTCDGCSIPMHNEWDPIATTELAFTRHRLKTGAQGRPTS
ncbi:hypothetical protein [Aquabacterium sp. CECT 9606]|uniref:hypothetical protein n=1 Tax=Aquabacterium sp. CECT 9606 TaxID=2845822 RepID=UPI001E4A7123|nr:hypothetical protein [Aquabacterium sp. CECT 9606]CAH0354078.1 hypothetical protein AQB9606_03464 [Aquabacterium sp. CECT 9606]